MPPNFLSQRGRRQTALRAGGLVISTLNRNNHNPSMSAPQIRALAICLFVHKDRVLVNESHDPVKGLSYCRPLGGGIEFGETGADAVVREIREEIGAAVSDVRYVGTLENIFTYLGNPGHEIVQIYDARLVDVLLYERGVVAGAESDGQPFVASWRSLGSFGPKLPLYPDGLLELLRSKAIADVKPTPCP